MGARPHLRQRIVAARPDRLPAVGRTRCGQCGTGWSSACRQPRPPQRRSCEIRWAERAVRAPVGCPRGCGSRRGRGAGRRARGRRCRTARTSTGWCARRRSRGSRRRGSGAWRRGSRGDGAGRRARPGRGRAARASSSSPGSARAGWVMPVSTRCSSRYEVRQCAGAVAAQQREQRPTVGERRRPHAGHRLERRVRGRCCRRAG